MIFSATNNNVKIAGNLFLNGEIIIYPTDTIYGIGVDATNTTAINKLNKLKNREMPLSIIVGSFKMLKKYAKTEKFCLDKVKKMLPGCFTVLLDKKKCNLSKKITLDSKKIGIRIPDAKFIIDVVNYINRPIVTTSINLHGKLPMNNIELISKNYSNINIFKGVINNTSKGSTIIEFNNNDINIIRNGDGIIVE